MAEFFFDPTHETGLDTVRAVSDESRRIGKTTPDNSFLETAVPPGVWPHHLVFTIMERDPKTNKITKTPVVSWSILFGTKDAAISQARYIQTEMKKLRGLSPWSEVARMVKCKVPSLLAKHKNLDMTVQPKEIKSGPAKRKPTAGTGPRHPAGTSPAPTGTPPAGIPEFLQYLRESGLVIVPASSIAGGTGEAGTGTPPKPKRRSPKRNPPKKPSPPIGSRSRKPVRNPPKPAGRVSGGGTSRKSPTKAGPKNTKGGKTGNRKSPRRS